MDTFHMPLLIILALNAVTPGWAGCLTGCSCTDDSVGRSLLCMETPMGRVPEDVPGDLTKIRIENSRLSELPPGSFSGVPALEFLWLNFNDIALMSVDSLRGLANLTELRLQGNKLSSVPWTAFRDTPSLKILDLKHNRLDVLPEHALGHLPGLTYFDVSFNRLSVVSRDVFLNWPLYRATEKAWGKEGVVSNVVLALHDNPWLCDCRLKGFVEFVRAVSPPLLLMNSYLTCSGPGPKAGRFFHEIQLKTCSKPVASAPRTNITLPPGAKLTLTCLVKARPDPTIHWTYSLKIIRGFSVTEAHVDEETVRSQLEIPSLQPADRGSYTCAANNFIGNSSATIGVDVRLDNSSGPVPVVSSPSADENVAIDVRIAKQTVYGVTLEWYASTADPADTWFTIHFGKYDSAKKETIYIGPGINSYSVSDLLPVTKYEVCVTLKNRSPRAGQCIVFVTGSDVSALEQRERLIHVVVIVCAMALAVPAGMYACTTEARFRRPACCSSLCRKRRMHSEELQERQGTFDSLQAASDEGLCRDMAEEGKTRRRSEDKSRGGGAAQLY